MRLIRSVSDPDRPHMRPHSRQRRILTHALRTISLNGLINDFERRVWHQNLRLRNLDKGGFGISSVDGGGCVEHNEAGGVDVDASFSYPVQNHTLVGELLAKGFLVRGVGACEEPAEGFFGLGWVS